MYAYIKLISTDTKITTYAGESVTSDSPFRQELRNQH
jgi:hypothetical protein